MNAVDTNILIYANDSREPEKRIIAEKVIGELRDGILLWQVACEYIAAARKLERFGFSQSEAFADLKYLSNAWPVIFPNWKVMEKTEELVSGYSISFWDAALVAACVENEIETLYSEDMGDHFRKIGLRIIDPFH